MKFAELYNLCESVEEKKIYLIAYQYQDITKSKLHSLIIANNSHEGYNIFKSRKLSSKCTAWNIGKANQNLPVGVIHLGTHAFSDPYLDENRHIFEDLKSNDMKIWLDEAASGFLWIEFSIARSLLKPATFAKTDPNNNVYCLGIANPDVTSTIIILPQYKEIWKEEIMQFKKTKDQQSARNILDSLED